MALSEDQKALLRLLAQGDVSIEDIAALKGMSVEQVQAEVSAALGESQKAAEPAKEEPKAPAPEPEPEKPEPVPVAKSKPKPSKPAPARQARPRPSVPPERRRLLSVAGGALALIAIVLGAIALFSDNDSGSGGANTAQLGGVEDDRVTQAVLSPPDGGDAAGNAVFGRLGEEEVVLQVTAEGLEPTTAGQSYTVWLYRSPKLSLRVGAVKAEEGSIGARFPVPPELLAYIGGGAFNQIYVSRTSDAAYQREVAKSREENRLPRYSGETVLTGEIVGPIAEAADAAASESGDGAEAE